VSTNEAPHEMTLYLRLHAAPCAGEAPHLQRDVPKESLARTEQHSLNRGRVTLDPERLLLLEG